MTYFKKSNYITIYDLKKYNKHIVFHSYYGNIMLINDDVATFINYFETPKTIKEYCDEFQVDSNIIDQILKDCISKKFLIKINSIDDKSKSEINSIKLDKTLDYYPERLLRFYVTSKCNMMCKYCFERNKHNDKDMSLETVKDGLEAFSSFLRENNKEDYKLIKVNFFGGEPLIRFDLIENSYKYIHKIIDPHGKDLKITINTNGTLLDDKKIEWIVKNRIHVYLSIDGLKAQNDKNRVFKNGQGTFDTIIEKLKILINKADSEYIEKYLTILVTVTANNIKQIEDLIIFLKSLGIKNISLNAAFNCAISGSSNFDWTTLSKEQVDTFIENAIDLQHRMYNSDLHIGGMWGYIPNRLKKGGLSFCQAVGYEIGISADKNLYPCPCTFGDIKLMVGKLEGKHFRFNRSFEKWQQRKVTNIPKCADCSISGICRGGCPGVAILNNKNIYSPQQCNFWEKFVEAYIDKAVTKYT